MPKREGPPLGEDQREVGTRVRAISPQELGTSPILTEKEQHYADQLIVKMNELAAKSVVTDNEGKRATIDIDKITKGHVPFQVFDYIFNSFREAGWTKVEFVPMSQGSSIVLLTYQKMKRGNK